MASVAEADDEWAEATRAINKLINAYQNNDAALAREAIAEGGDPSFTWGDAKHTPLQGAVQGGWDAMMLVLLEGGARVHDRRVPSGHTAILLAAALGRTDAIKTLANFGADVNDADNEGTTAVSLAAQQDQTDAVRLLASLGSDVNSADKYGVTPIMACAELGVAGMIRTLASLGGDVNKPDIDSATPWWGAAVGDNRRRSPCVAAHSQHNRHKCSAMAKMRVFARCSS